MEVDLSDEELLFLMARDDDGFARWDAGQALMLRELKAMLIAQQTGQSAKLSDALIAVLGDLLTDRVSDPAMLALMLALPTQSYLGDVLQPVSAQAVFKARQTARLQIAQVLEDKLLACYERLSSSEPYRADAEQIAKRSLRNSCLTYLSLLDNSRYIDLAAQQFEAAANMTDVQAALSALVNSPVAAAEEVATKALAAFYDKWQHESLVVNQWLQLQAAAQKPGALSKVKELLAHPAFDANNPNKLRSVVGAFAQANLINFHAADGSGYDFLAEQVIETDKRNPQMASRLLNPLVKWQVQPESQQGAMLAALKRVAEQEALSPDVSEVVGKALKG
jgi:aminopeptidase N